MLFIIFIKIIIKINVNISKLSYLPKITIYLPLYNKQKYIRESIRSIQNQKLKNIEIIAVNDYSTDNTLKILKKLSKEDSRIKVINNDNNHGVLYTRAMGIFNSSGEFVMSLDPDDTLKGNNSLKYLYNIANLYNLDIVSFSFLSGNKNYSKCFYKSKIIKQPLILKSAFNKKNKINDFLLWNKLVKRQLMLKVCKISKKKIYNNKWNYADDTFWSILINKYAESMMCINKIIYIYNKNDESLVKNNINIVKLKNRIYYLEMNIKIFTNKIENKYLISNILDFITYLKKNKKLVISLLKNNLEVKKKIVNILLILIEKYNFPFVIIKKLKLLIFFIKYFKYYLE